MPRAKANPLGAATIAAFAAVVVFFSLPQQWLAAPAMASGALTLPTRCGNTPNMTLSRPTNSCRSSPAGDSPRQVWLSIFDNWIPQQSNAVCGLGAGGEIMTSFRVEETHGNCVHSPLLALLNPASNLSYYALELSADAQIVTAFRLGCDSKCFNCEYVVTRIEAQTCLSFLNSKGTGHFSAAVDTDPKNEGCVGPYITSHGGPDDIILIETLATGGDMSMCPSPSASDESEDSADGVDGPTTDTSATLVFAFSLGIANTTCHDFSLFHANYSYLFTVEGDGYSFEWCNGRDCTACMSLFDELPIGECRANTFNKRSGQIILLHNDEVNKCAPRPSRWFIGVVFGGLIVVFVAFGTAVAVHRRHQRRVHGGKRQQSHPSPHSNERIPLLYSEHEQGTAPINAHQTHSHQHYERHYGQLGTDQPHTTRSDTSQH